MLIKPIVTEKSTRDLKKDRYTFEVVPESSKTDVKRAVEKLFGVAVVKVATIKMPGKTYRTGKRFRFAKRQDGKKAVVTLKKGQKIDLFQATGK